MSMEQDSAINKDWTKNFLRHIFIIVKKHRSRELYREKLKARLIEKLNSIEDKYDMLRLLKEGYSSKDIENTRLKIASLRSRLG